MTGPMEALDNLPFPFCLPDPLLRKYAKELKEMNRVEAEHLVPVDRKSWGPLASSSDRIFEVWRSRYFLVQMHRHPTIETIERLTVNRAEIDTTNRRWRDGITWDELQEIKRQVGRGDLDAVEVYPRDQDIVNVANMRHLWVFRNPADLPYVWRKKGKD